MDQLWKTVHHYFFRGGELLGNGWDGEDCHNEVPIHIKQREVLVWTIAILFLAQAFRHDRTIFHIQKIIHDMKRSESHHHLTSFEKYLDMFFLVSCGFGWGMLVYYKVLMRYMIYLLQPCHMTMFLHFITFMNVDFFAPIVSLLWLPMTAGSMSAILFPSTSELTNPYEVEMYWVEHILIQVIPLYLLVRKSGAILKHFSWNHVFFGNLLVMCLHWWVFEFTNNTFRVNVNFFTCPTYELGVYFNLLNSWLPDAMKLPSYRNFYMFLFISTSIISSFLYVTVARILLSIINKVTGREEKRTKRH